MVLQLIYLLGLLLLALLALRSFRGDSQRRSIAAPPGEEEGSLETYLARIEVLAAEGHDEFFVAATEKNGERFIQVSAGRDQTGVLRYQFDLPVTEWSRGYAVRIEAEARHRGFDAMRQASGPMTFLDIDFDTSGDHAAFVRWVISDVFGLSPTARFHVTWG